MTDEYFKFYPGKISDVDHTTSTGVIKPVAAGLPREIHFHLSDLSKVSSQKTIVGSSVVFSHVEKKADKKDWASVVVEKKSDANE